MQKKWILKNDVSEISGLLSSGLNIRPVTASILSGRNISSVSEAQLFLNPLLTSILDPLQLKGMEDAVKRLLVAHTEHEPIFIYGDYDVDGITGTALLVSFLRETGFDCRYFIPNRFDDGYGLNCDSIKQISSLGASLIISVDCGIAAVKEALFCKELSIDLIVVDHHAPGDTIPDAAAVINPLQPGCNYPFKALAGVGVAFNLLVALRSALREAGVFGSQPGPDLRQWLDLVALGTIADVVSLTGQNRIYAFHGLKQLSNSNKPGIVALKKVAGITGDVSCGQVGFRLAPRLNAAGRMESAVPGVDLLLSNDEQVSQLISGELDAANAERQNVERSIFDEAVKLVESSGMYPDCHSIVLASNNWHQGVVGIVASRLVERYNRPTILIAINPDGTAKGSGRSIHGFHLLDALKPCSGFLERFGGHRYAAGVSINPANLDVFAKAFEFEAAGKLTADDLIPRLEIDAEIQPEELNSELVSELKRLEPFGAGNPEPVLMIRGLKVLERRVVGEGHLKLRLSCKGRSFNAIAFKMSQRETDGLIDVVFFPEMNEWNGSSSLQLKVKDLRAAE
jgi:single-stranded-DNA-specific exonuclease